MKSWNGISRIHGMGHFLIVKAVFIYEISMILKSYVMIYYPDPYSILKLNQPFKCNSKTNVFQGKRSG